MKTEMTPEELKVAARDLIHIHLGNPTGQAQTMVEQLDDAEVKAIVDAGADRATAREAIKGVFTSAYDRRQREHAKEATSDQKRLENRASAKRTLIANGYSDQQVNSDLIPKLSDGEQSILAGLEGEHDVKEIVVAVIGRATLRVAAAAEQVTVETGPETLSVAEVNVSDPPLADTTSADPVPAAEPKPTKHKKN